MLRPCTINPLLSPFEAMEGHYSFDATPMAPMGTEMLMNLKPVRRHSWVYHTLKAWYIGPARKHYGVIKGVTDLGAVLLTDTWNTILSVAVMVGTVRELCLNFHVLVRRTAPKSVTPFSTR